MAEMMGFICKYFGHWWVYHHEQFYTFHECGSASYMGGGMVNVYRCFWCGKSQIRWQKNGEVVR
jgi:hypothetical protein